MIQKSIIPRAFLHFEPNPENQQQHQQQLSSVKLEIQCHATSQLQCEDDPNSTNMNKLSCKFLSLAYPESPMVPCEFDLFSLYKMVASDSSLPQALQPKELTSELVKFLFSLIFFFFFFSKKKQYHYYNSFHFKNVLFVG